MDNSNQNNPNPPYNPAVTPSSSPAAPGVNSSSVIVPVTEEKLPFWFYILFTVVAVLFFFVTFLLIKTLMDNQKQKTIDNLVPIETRTLTPTVILTPTVSPIPIDDYLESLKQQNQSDEIIDIEADLDKTDLGKIKTDLDKVDTALNP